MALICALVLPMFGLLLTQPVEADVSAQLKTVSSWNGGGQYSVVLSNSGSSPVCAVTYAIQLPSGTTISSKWNMEGDGPFSTPSWLQIGAGASDSSAGFNVMVNGAGGGIPTVSVLSSTTCGGGSSGGGGGGGGQNPPPTTTTTTTTTASPGSGGGGDTGATMTVTTDPSNAAINKCYENNATGPIIARLNQPITGGKFTFYGAGGTGACGQNSGAPSMSAAVSGSFFGGNWVPPCTGTQSILNNAVCINKCVKITYTCVGCSSAKTLIVPINNQCPECEPGHVDLSIAAFNYLEPQGGTVGIAKNAVITYIKCP